MDLHILIILILLITVVGCLAFTRIAADVVLMAALSILILTNILTPIEALSGFSNPGVMTIAILYIVASGLKETGAVQWIAHYLLGKPNSIRGAQQRLFAPTAFLSAFVSNTSVVSMFIPAIQDWADRLKIPASKLLIPLSYAAILGGTCTLIGTSTNLVIDGMLQREFDQHLNIFELAWVGLPITILGAGYLYLFGSRLLPVRQNVNQQLEQVREYCVEFQVLDDGIVAGNTIADAGLRHLRSGYLLEVRREDSLMNSVSSTLVLKAGDILTFIGAPETAKELRKVQGLAPATGSLHKLAVENHERCLVEVVIGPDFSALNKSIRDSQFRSYYDAVVLSVSRAGERIPGKLGDIKLKVGDTLLLEASEKFVSHYQYRKDFMLVSALNDSTPPDFSKAHTALIILLAMVGLSASDLLSILEAGLLAAGAMIVTKCVTVSRARRSVDLRVLVVIAASFSLGMAMQKTGAAQLIAEMLLPLTSISPLVALIVIYLLTLVFTEFITNNAAAVLMFPIAVTVAEQIGVNHLPFIIAIMIAASASFITPLGYQTNLMVYGPGQYRFSDYVRVGLPLSVIVALTALTIIPRVWGF